MDEEIYGILGLFDILQRKKCQISKESHNNPSHVWAVFSGCSLKALEGFAVRKGLGIL